MQEPVFLSAGKIIYLHIFELQAFLSSISYAFSFSM